MNWGVALHWVRVAIIFVWLVSATWLAIYQNRKIEALQEKLIKTRHMFDNTIRCYDDLIHDIYIKQDDFLDIGEVLNEEIGECLKKVEKLERIGGVYDG